MRLHIGLLAIAVVSAALVSDEAEASPIIFFDRAQFEADVQPDLLVTFNTFQPDVCYPSAFTRRSQQTPLS